MDVTGGIRVALCLTEAGRSVPSKKSGSNGTNKRFANTYSPAIAYLMLGNWKWQKPSRDDNLKNKKKADFGFKGAANMFDPCHAAWLTVSTSAAAARSSQCREERRRY